MEKITWRYLIVTVMTCLVAFAVHVAGYTAFEPSDGEGATEIRIPERLGPWTGTDVPLDELVYRVLETRAIIHRNYTSDSGPVFLSVVYYPETKVDFHAPEGCLAGEGVQISKSVRRIRVRYQGREREIRLNQLVRRGSDSQELIYYFYKAGDFMGDSYLRLRASLVWNRFCSNSRSGALIRVSTPVTDDGGAGSASLLRDFIETLYPHAIQHL